MTQPEQPDFTPGTVSDSALVSEFDALVTSQVQIAKDRIDAVSALAQAIYERHDRARSMFFEPVTNDVYHRSVLLLVNSATPDFGCARVLVNDEIENGNSKNRRSIKSYDFTLSPFVRNIESEASELTIGKNGHWVISSKGFFLRRSADNARVDVKHSVDFETDPTNDTEPVPIKQSTMRTLDIGKTAVQLHRILNPIHSTPSEGGPMPYSFVAL